MSDLQPTDPDPTDEATLRVLLHRAVDDLEVPPFDALASTVVEFEPRRPRRTTWLAAAAVLVLVAGGVAWWARGQGDERIDAGPAAQIDPVVVEQSGIWRLPAEGSGFEVTEAMQSTVRLPLQIAVDDVDAPTRLLAIIPGGYDLIGHAEAEPTEPFTDHTTMTLLRGGSATETSWLQITGEGHGGYLTFAYVGLGDGEVQVVARSLVDQIGDESASLTNTPRIDAALRSFQPPAGLVPTWDPDDIGLGTGAFDGSGPVTSIGLRLVGPDGGGITGVSVRRMHLPQAVAIEWYRIQTTSPVTAPTTNVSGAPRRLTERSDLGRGVLVASLDGVDTVTVITDDGTEITAQSAIAGDGDGAGAEPLTIEEQLDVINSLRSVGEDELRERLDAAGVPIRDPRDQLDETNSSVDGGSAPTTTIATPAPTTTVGG